MWMAFLNFLFRCVKFWKKSLIYWETWCCIENNTLLIDCTLNYTINVPIILLPHSALFCNFSLAENLASLSLQDGARSGIIFLPDHHISCATTTTYPALPPPHILRYHPPGTMDFKVYLHILNISATNGWIVLKF